MARSDGPKKKPSSRPTGRSSSSSSSRARPRKSSSGNKRSSRTRPGGGWLRLLILGGLGFSGIVLLASLGAYAYFASRLDEAMAGRRWDLPSRLYPTPLVLTEGGRLPPGPISATLESLGYLKTTPVQRPGEYRVPEPGHVYLNARPGWPGLEHVPEKTLDLRHKGPMVTSVKRHKGPPLPQATIPPVPFAELRGPDQETRKPVEFKAFPPHLVNAVVAIEDKRFYAHAGVDPIGLTRALLVNLVRGGRAQGGSTITQQLAKNYFLTHEKTLTRKLKELFYALALERRLSKEQILAMYLNEIYLGQRGPVAVSGMAQAAYTFFSKELGQLRLEESALLAALIQSPNAYAPDRHGERAKARRDLVLDKMLEQGTITAEEHGQARKQPLTLRLGPYLNRTAPFFVDYVSDQLSQRFPDTDFTVEGYALETTLNLRVQQAAEAALADHLATLDPRSKVPLEGAVVAVEPSSGRILAMVGGRNYGQSQYNRAVLAQRQTGSVIKPLVYLAALQARGRDLQPTSLLQDEPLTLTLDGKAWSPQNNDRQFRGSVTLRQALEQSLNVPTVRLALDVGMDKVIGLLKDLGFGTRMRSLPSYALGAFEASPLEVAQAFTAVANGGTLRRVYAVERVRDARGEVLFAHRPEHADVARETETYLIRDLMRGVLEHGTGRSAREQGYTFEASGKTGTTNEFKDAWFVGFDAEVLVVVWVGSDQAVPTGLTGSRGALPIWTRVMKAVRGTHAPPPDPLPTGLERAKVCAESLEAATEHCTETVAEVFWRGAVPGACSLHRPGAALAPLLEGLQGLLPGRSQTESGDRPGSSPAEAEGDRPSSQGRPLRGLLRRVFSGED